MSTPITVAGTDILTIFRWARFIKHVHGSKTGGNLEISGKHGTVYTPDKTYDESDIFLEVGLPLTSESAAHEALSTMARIFSSVSQVTIAQTDPFRGDIQAHVELAAEPTPSQDRLSYLYILTNPGVFWEDVAATVVSSGSPPAITTGGDSPIDDMVLTYAGPGYFEFTDLLGVDHRFTVDAAAGAGTYVLDFGPRTVQKAGVDQDEHITFTDDFAMRWPAGTVLTVASDVGVAVSYRNKWA